jgi:Flp pilus assembly pilin Flp
MTTLSRLWNDDEAANAVEYGLITAVIAVALIAALIFFRDRLNQKFQTSAEAVQGAQ